MTLEQYIDNINKRYKQGNATKHAFRGDLQQLLESLVPTISATNKAKKKSCGTPDYILTRKGISVGFIEAKDIGDKDIDGTNKMEIKNNLTDTKYCLLTYFLRTI